MSKFQKNIYFLSLFVIAFVIYYRAIYFDFVNWDDPKYLVYNDDVRDFSWNGFLKLITSYYVSNYHPLTMITYFYEYKLSGGSAWLMHLNNIILHAVNSILVFVFIYRISKENVIPSIVVSVLFAIHPMHVESVAWVSERKDVLYTFFYFLSLLSYLDYLDTKNNKKLLFCFLFFLLSLLSKAMAVVLPLTLVLIDFYKNGWSWKSTISKWYFFLVAFIFGLIAIKAQQTWNSFGGNSMFSIFDRLFFASYGTVMYLQKLVFPTGLQCLYEYPEKKLSGLPYVFYISGIIYPVIIFLLYRFRKNRDVVFAILFFLINIAIVLQFVTVGSALYADRYSYISYIGLFFLIGNLIQYLYEKYTDYKKEIIINLAVVVLLYCVLSWNRIKVWTNSEMLWTDVIEKSPDCTTAYQSRGTYYGKLGFYEKALADFDKAISLRPTNASLFVNKGLTLVLYKEDYTQALENFLMATRFRNFDNNAYDGYMNAAFCYDKLGQPEAAKQMRKKAEQIKVVR